MPVTLAAVLAMAVLGAPLAAPAQPAGKISRVGFVSVQPVSSSPEPRFQAFRQELRALGWVDGQNVVVEYRWGEGQEGRLRALASELVRFPVDVIVTTDLASTLAARSATGTIPIVGWFPVDPVKAGLVASLARPGGNVTGLTDVTSLSGKLLELLKETVPGLKRVAVLRNPAGPAAATHRKEVDEAARALGLELQVLDVRGPADWDGAFAAMVKGRSQALTMLLDAMFARDRRPIADRAVKHGLPTVYSRREFVEDGGLMSYGTDRTDVFRRQAGYVDRILRGTKAADLPVEQPTKFELVVNLKTARALGLTIPPAVLARAGEVIE
jgi:putative ABC transport system substrate-binding protein